MKTYPDMNGKIVEILRWCTDDPVSLYAAARIVELEQELRVEHQAHGETKDTLTQYCKVLLNVEQWDDLYPDLSAYDTLHELKDQASGVLE